MARANLNRVTFGNAILGRFASVGVPPSLKVDHKAFKEQHGAFVAANKAADKAEEAYESAARALGAVDSRRDKTVLEIADRMPAAGLGRREAPFATFSKHAPSRLVSLPYAAEANEVRALLAAIIKAKPPADIAKLCARAALENESVSTALDDLTSPAAALNEARARRDAAIPDWEKSLRHLKDAAKVAFRDTTGRFATVFAEPEAVQTHVRPKPRAKKAAAPSPAEPAEQTAAAPSAPVAKKAKRKTRSK